MVALISSLSFGVISLHCQHWIDIKSLGCSSKLQSDAAVTLSQWSSTISWRPSIKGKAAANKLSDTTSILEHDILVFMFQNFASVEYNYHTITNATYWYLWNTMRLIGDPLQRINLSIGSQIELEKSCHNSNTRRQRNCVPPSLWVLLGVALFLLLKTGAKDVAPETARCSRVGHNCPIKCMSTWLKSSNTNFFKFDPTVLNTGATPS